VWFVCVGGRIAKINAATRVATDIGQRSGLLSSRSAVVVQFSDVAFGLGSVWLVDRAANRVDELDPFTNLGQPRISVGQAPTAIAVGTDVFWVANFKDDTVTRVEIPGPGSPPVPTTFRVGDGPVDIAIGDGAVWVVNQLDRTVMRLDPETGDVVATIGVGNDPQRVAAGEGAVWVTVRAPADD
jgi:streptogramin lyase